MPLRHLVQKKVLAMPPTANTRRKHASISMSIAQKELSMENAMQTLSSCWMSARKVASCVVTTGRFRGIWTWHRLKGCKVPSRLLAGSRSSMTVKVSHMYDSLLVCTILVKLTWASLRLSLQIMPKKSRRAFWILVIISRMSWTRTPNYAPCWMYANLSMKNVRFGQLLENAKKIQRT